MNRRFFIYCSLATCDERACNGHLRLGTGVLVFLKMKAVGCVGHKITEMGEPRLMCITSHVPRMRLVLNYLRQQVRGERFFLS